MGLPWCKKKIFVIGDMNIGDWGYIYPFSRSRGIDLCSRVYENDEMGLQYIRKISDNEYKVDYEIFEYKKKLNDKEKLNLATGMLVEVLQSGRLDYPMFDSVRNTLNKIK